MIQLFRGYPGFWSTLWLLLGAARKRAAGRRKHQQELLYNRAGKNATNWSGLGSFFAVLLMVILNGMAAFVVTLAIEAGQRLESERRGSVVVSRRFLDAVNLHTDYRVRLSAELGPYYFSEARRIAQTYGGSQKDIEHDLRDAVRTQGTRNLVGDVGPDEHMEAEHQGKIAVSGQFLNMARAAEALARINDDQSLEPYYSSEADGIVERYGGSRTAVEKKLRDAVKNHGTRDFLNRDEACPGLSGLPGSGRLTAMFGSVILFWWAAMLVFQSEGLELDLQRRRHPMWEWLFSHPVPPGAVFLAEMLSPLAANPIYWGAPLFVGVLYGHVYSAELGLLAALLIGIPVSVAAACLGKALEVGVVLRFPPRSRGAITGFMSWLGYASLMLFFLGAFFIPKAVTALGDFLEFLTAVPWPWLRLFLGGQFDNSFSFFSGMFACWFASGVTIAGAIWFSVWATQQGLSGNSGAKAPGPSVPRSGATHFGKEPLYRKEFLWFIRDRSAIVQTILIPVTVASIQVFNLRGLLSHAQGAWNSLCGVAILFGTYFLWVLGPKSLSSEGTALWIALTWPRGLEGLLKAKAWLWSLISSGLVALVLCYAAYLFPADLWKIGLVGFGWFIFGRSMAEKSVTLVTSTSSSGEQEKVPQGRKWAASLGMLTFSIGILTEQWPLAVVGIVYSYITAAAMWQNFRARLPYLYDPWSEKIPPPPTLMHAMIAISILVEGAAVLTGISAAIAGLEYIAVAQAFSYGVCAIAVSLGISSFLSDRGVPPGDVWNWKSTAEEKSGSWWGAGKIQVGEALLLLVLGAAGGLVLGLVAAGYMAVLQHIPAAAEILRKSQEQMAKIPNLKLSYTIMAVGFAPFAEEYLFRGLLFRALDREWGGWRAILGSAAFFAIYHPPLAWFPVALLGITNAVLFKKTGRLVPAVILHMVYNAAVLH
ncbi:MAG TPA: CPBP family glutamic-type intramembrane protease [Candidatus Acidoferrum sp.]|nr:CPBP family glutamic-type intramembrane protease [Candidatus Acidoferrum sp.]